MAEQWIEAATARRLVGELPKNPFGTEALCQRAHAGLAKAGARLLVRGNERAENVLVPREFWQSTAAVDLSEDWRTGDFSAQIDRTEQWQAFGVTFALSGVLEMLPFEQRAVTARGLSVAGNPGWITARAARQFAYEKAGVSPTKAHMAVLDEARLGFITGRAVLAQRFLSGPRGISLDDPPAWEEREWDIPASFWRDFKVRQGAPFDWERGIFSGEVPWGRGACVMRLEGVHFLKESLQGLLPATDTEAPSGAAPAEPEGTKGPSAGGRPPQAWWDDMMVAVAGLILHGQLQPKRQAEVTDAMLTWAALNGHDISESAVKPKAKKLFEAYAKEGRNFLKGGS